MSVAPFAKHELTQPARQVWLPVTVRVAWSLVVARVNVRPELLNDAREHVLRHLPPGVSEGEAERLATLYTEDFLSRARTGRIVRIDMESEQGLNVPDGWPRRLTQGLDDVGDAILRLHYGDGLTIQAVEEHTRIDETALVAAREGLREMLRIIADTDGDSLDDWTDKRIDQELEPFTHTTTEGTRFYLR